jgi:two-component sensor histidine kinase
LFCDTAGVLWIATIGEGLYSLGPNQEVTGRFVHTPGNDSSLRTNDVVSLAGDKWGNLWVGTVSGLSVLDRESGSFQTFTEKDGLGDAFIYAILSDDEGNLWVSTNRGISRCKIAGRSERDVAPRPPFTLEISNFDVRDGLQGNEFNVGSAFRSIRGELFFGGPKGYNRFFPDMIVPNRFEPPVALTSFQKLGQEVRIDGSLASIPLVELEHSDYFFSFEYTALDFHIPERNRYRYLMEGLDEDWIDAGNRRFVTYTNLDPGDYTFRVKGSNSDGVWNEAGTSVKIVIHPPYWQTWWFRGVVIAAIVGILVAGYRYRVNRLLEIERLRTRISSDLHDELASNLNSIALFSSIMKEKGTEGKNEAPEREQFLQRITTLAEESVGAIRDMIWAIDPKKETLRNLLARLGDSMVTSCRAKNIVLTIELAANSFPEPDLGPDVRHHLWMLLKEAINNAIKHSRGTEISVHSEVTKDNLSVSIADNGKGFDANSLKRGRGLTTMEMRAEQLRGNVRVESTIGKGTTVFVRVRIS